MASGSEMAIHEPLYQATVPCSQETVEEVSEVWQLGSTAIGSKMANDEPCQTRFKLYL